MKIVILRHGLPDFDAKRWVHGTEATDGLRDYSLSRVVIPPVKDLQELLEVQTLYPLSSELPRARDSARLLGIPEPEISGLLNEADLPHPDRLIIPLPWKWLLAICRIAWLFGYSRNATGKRSDVARAQQAADLLIRRASEHQSILAVGHGIMNSLISRELRSQGWVLDAKPGSQHWSGIVLKFDKSE